MSQIPEQTSMESYSRIEALIEQNRSQSAFTSQLEAQRIEFERRFEAERDRRYTELRAADQRALQIKEQADRDALQLSRESQTYKDEQANRLREQINNERGKYATKDDLKAAVEKIEAIMTPLIVGAASQSGRSSGQVSQRELIGWVLALISALILIGKFVFKA